MEAHQRKDNGEAQNPSGTATQRPETETLHLVLSTEAASFCGCPLQGNPLFLALCAIKTLRSLALPV